MRILLVLLIAAGSVHLLPAQPPPAPPAAKARPRIGVALAGGAALGIAHIGVLKWLEENRIPVDFIAGTSMGGLTGGLYAVGYTPAEMERFVAEIEWSEALAGNAPFQQQIYRRKEDFREYPSRFEFGWKKGVKLPSGLSAGHGVGLVLSRFTAPWGDLKSFDELPTPFRCIAADVVSTKQVVFSSGPLFRALRATMSLPAIFAPVEMDKMLLVDGGIVNNLPVDVVRQMGADIVIAVTLEAPADPAGYGNLLKIASRSISVMIATNERNSLAHADLVIGPKLEGLTTSDYAKYEELIERGYEAARERAFLLQKLQLTEQEYQVYRARRAQKRRLETIKPEIVEIAGRLAPERDSLLRRSIAADPTRPIDRDRLEDSLTRITGLGRYDAVEYDFIRRDGKEGIEVRVHEKQHGPPFFRVGFTIDGNTADTLRFGIGGRLTFLDVGGPLSEWRSDFSIGQLNRLGTEYYYRIRGSRYFVAPRVFYDESTLPIYVRNREVADYSQRVLGGGADVGYAFGRFKELRIGWRMQSLETVLDRGLNIIPNLNGTISEFRVRWVHEGQDSPMVPTRGTRIVAEGFYGVNHPQVSRNYPGFESTVSRGVPLQGRYSLLLNAAGGATRDDPGHAFRFSVGGPLLVSSLSPREIFGNRYYAASGFVLRSMTSDSLSLFGKFYAALGYELGRAWTAQTPATPRHSGTLGLIGETPFGVVFFGGALGDQGDKKLFFRLGRTF